MTVDVQALSATISVAVSQAVQKALRQAYRHCILRRKHQGRRSRGSGPRGRFLTVHGTAQGLAATAFPMVINKQTISILAIALGSRVSPKIKAKI